MADELDVSVGARIDGLLTGLTRAVDGIKGLVSPVEEVASHLKEVAELVAAAFAVEKVSEFFERMEQGAIQTQRAMTLLGTTAEGVARLDVTAQAAGSTLDSLTHAMERLGLQLARADAGSLQAQAGLAVLGIQASTFQAMSLDQKMQVLADKFSVLKDGIDKDAIAMALLGRAGAEMIPVFNQGSHAIQEFDEMVARAGGASTPEFLAAMHSLHLQGIELNKSLGNLGETIATTFASSFAGVRGPLVDFVEWLNKSIQKGGELHPVLELLAGAAKAFASALVVGVAAMEALWKLSSTVIKGMIDDFMSLGTIIKNVFTFNFAAAADEFQKFGAQVAARTETIAAQMEGVWKGMTGRLSGIWQSGADHHVGIEQTKNAKLSILNKDNVTAAIAAEEAKIKAADDAFKLAQERVDTDYKLHVITEGQKTAALLAALEQRKAAETSAINAELAIGGLSKTQYQKILDEKLSMERKYVLDKQKIVDQAALEEMKTYNQVFSAVQGAFNAQLRGLLSGTVTWAQAMKNIAGDLIIKLIELVEKWVFEWAAGELARTTATTAGVTARAGAEQAGAVTSMAANFVNIVKSIMASAAQTFAGIFGFLSPVMGPAAAGPALAGEATVAAAAGAVPALDVGTDMVLKSGLAFIHRGESVTPAQTSGPFSGQGQGGGASVTINVSAMDGASVHNWLQKGGSAVIAKAVAKAMSANPTLRPAY